MTMLVHEYAEFFRRLDSLPFEEQCQQLKAALKQQAVGPEVLRIEFTDWFRRFALDNHAKFLAMPPFDGENNNA